MPPRSTATSPSPSNDYCPAKEGVFTGATSRSSGEFEYKTTRSSATFTAGPSRSFVSGDRLAGGSRGTRHATPNLHDSCWWWDDDGDLHGSGRCRGYGNGRQETRSGPPTGVDDRMVQKSKEMVFFLYENQQDCVGVASPPRNKLGILEFVPAQQSRIEYSIQTQKTV